MAKKKLKFLTIIAVIVIAALIAILLPGYTKLQDLKTENEKLENRIKALSKSIEGLKAEKEKLESDITYIEKVAREKLGTAREGEVVIKEKD